MFAIILRYFSQNSPFYEEHTSYWIGASDKHLEGDYRWIDGTSYSYSSKLGKDFELLKCFV